MLILFNMGLIVFKQRLYLTYCLLMLFIYKLFFFYFRYVFLNLGGNDINSTTNPDEVFHDIMYVVNELYRYGVKRVFVASILARGKFPIWTGLSIKTFTVMRRSINKKLGADFIEVGKRLMFPRHYDKDLVHPGYVEGGLNIFNSNILNTFKKTL